MSSSLFQQTKQNSLSDLQQLAQGIMQNNPEALFNQMYNSNSQFKRFIDENKGRSVEDIARKYGIPL